MKKLFVFCFLVLVSVCSLFAESLTGIWDINFGDSQKTVEKKIDKKGWSKESSEALIKIEKTTGTYGSLAVKNIWFSFSDKNTLEDISINFDDSVSLSDYIDLKDVLVLKYQANKKDESVLDDYYSLNTKSENNIEMDFLYVGNVISIHFIDNSSNILSDL